MSATAGAAPEVVMYSTAWCGYCQRARNLLERKGVAVREVKIDEDPKERDIMLARSSGRQRTDLLATRIGVPAARDGISRAFDHMASRSTSAKGALRSAQIASSSS